jgi:hypothetical protein
MDNESKKLRDDEQYRATFQPKVSPLVWPMAFDPMRATTWPMAGRSAWAAPTRAHDKLGTVVTTHRVAMVAWLLASILGVRCGEIDGRRTDAKWRSCRATS